MSKQPTGFYFAVNASAQTRAISYSKRQMEQELIKLLGQIPKESRPQFHYQSTLNLFYICYDNSNRNDLIAIRKLIEGGIVSFRSRVSHAQISSYHRSGYLISFHTGSRLEQMIRGWLESI